MHRSNVKQRQEAVPERKELTFRHTETSCPASGNLPALICDILTFGRLRLTCLYQHIPPPSPLPHPQSLLLNDKAHLTGHFNKNLLKQ